MAEGGPEDFFLTGNEEKDESSQEEPSPSLSIGFIKHAIANFEVGVSGNHFRTTVLESGAIQALFLEAYEFFSQNYPSSDDLTRLRFAEIVVVEGPDRALEAYGNYDAVWDQMEIPDTYTPPVVLFGASGDANVALDRMRDGYYQNISRRKDPRKEVDPRQEPIHYQETFQFVALGAEPNPSQRINVRYPLPPAHPEFTDDLPLETRRKMAIERRSSSGFFETGSFTTPQPTPKEPGLQTIQEEDQQNTANFQPIHPPQNEDLIHLGGEGGSLPQQQQQQQQQQSPPPDQQKANPSAKSPEPQVKTPLPSQNPAGQPRTDENQFWSKIDEDQYWGTVSPEPSKTKTSKLPPLASQEALLEFYKKEQLKQKRQQQSSSPVLRQQQQRTLLSPPVVNTTRPSPVPVVAQPGTGLLKSALRQPSPVAFPPPAIRQPSHMMPVVATRPVLPTVIRPAFGHSTPVRTNAPSSRSASVNPPSRPASGAVPLVVPPARPVPFFTKQPTVPAPSGGSAG